MKLLQRSVIRREKMATKVIHTTRTDGGWYQKPFADKPPLTEEQKLNKIKANAIRECLKVTQGFYDDTLEYAALLEEGKL